MATEQATTIVSYEAAADYSAKQFAFVKLHTTQDQVILCASQGERCDGILQNKPSAAGAVAEVCIAGQSKVLLGATITPGMLATVGADGQGEEAASSDFVAGRYSEGGADGEIGSMIFQPQGVL